MEVRDAVEADADRLAELADAPPDVMANLVHDRTVRVVEDDGVQGFVSFDARDGTVHVTQLGGDRAACERLLEEPARFARAEAMPVELVVTVDDEPARAAAEAAGFSDGGEGPRFDGVATVRYRRPAE